MLFHASATLTDRHGDPFREPKPSERPDPKTGFADEQLRVLRHGDIALSALDAAVEGDEKLMKDDPPKWVKAIIRRDEVSRIISEAMNGDGWAKINEEQRDLMVDRLALCALRLNVAMVGPVMHALRHPPENRPAALAKPNGRGRPASIQAAPGE